MTNETLDNKILETLNELKDLRIQLEDFSSTAEEAKEVVRAPFWYNLNQLYEIYVKYWRKLILYDYRYEKNKESDKCVIHDWGCATRWSENEEVNIIEYPFIDNPINFGNIGKKEWEPGRIHKAFEDIMGAYITRDDLAEILRKPCEDIEKFQKKLESAVKQKERELIKIYDERIINNKEVKKQTLLKSFFENKDVKKLIMKELLGVNMK